MAEDEWSERVLNVPDLVWTAWLNVNRPLAVRAVPSALPARMLGGRPALVSMLGSC